MLSASRQYMRQAPSYGLFPGLALTALVASLNVLADALRDAFDPHLSRLDSTRTLARVSSSA